MKLKSAKFFITVIALLFSVMQLFATENQSWYIVLDKPLASDEAIQVAIDDLNKSGEAFGIQFIKTTNTKKKYANSIIVGSPERNGFTNSLVEKEKLTLEGVHDEQGYEIITKSIPPAKKNESDIILKISADFNMYLSHFILFQNLKIKNLLVNLKFIIRVKKCEKRTIINNANSPNPIYKNAIDSETNKILFKTSKIALYCIFSVAIYTVIKKSLNDLYTNINEKRIMYSFT